ncbi:reticulon-1-A-like [Dendronephthya gigantea]|uniref:reticulon-1-A-like n=1 Tax=Dendronephthya gigantea TaxID=151771 RepID=UPI00106A9F6F|nr:reticulon-1-A-like [Dendronephthya gigantea]XP_028403696.1 reticulon-1-A-like [Dendronephthya gigantea]
MTFMDILYWRDPKKTGPIFVACLLLLYGFHHFSVVTVVTYLLKISLLPTLLFRLVISLKAALTKTECEHPFKDALDSNIESLVGMSLPKFVKVMLQECRRILLVEDVVDTVKVLAIVHVVSYLGEWFSGITLLFLGLVALFTIPKFYDVYKHEIHNMTDKVSKVMEDVKTRILAFIPTKSKSSASKKGFKEPKNVEEISPALEKDSDEEQKEKMS